MPAKTAAVLKHPVVTTVVVTASSSVLHLRTHGIVATAALPHDKTLAKKGRVKVAAVGKSVAVTTATLLVQPLAAQQVLATSLHAALSSLVPAISNPMRLRAKAQRASAVVHAY
jgi:hypothetical protein